MVSVYDADCPICKSQKKVRVLGHDGDNPKHTRTEFWGYCLSQNEVIIEAFCPNCGVKFIVGE